MNQENSTTMQAFKYEAPEDNPTRKVTWLARTDHLVAAVQYLKKGGEQALHSHAHLDGFWFVLKGRALFYTDKTTVFAEVGQFEGVLVPRGSKYWFESVGAEPVELMQVEASDMPFKSRDELRRDVTYYEERAPGSIPQHVDAKQR